MFKQAESAPIGAQKADIRCKGKSRHSKCCHLEEMPVIPEKAMEFLSRTWSPSSSDLFQILSPSVCLCLFQFSPTEWRHLLSSHSIVSQSTYKIMLRTTYSNASLQSYLFITAWIFLRRKKRIFFHLFLVCRMFSLLFTVTFIYCNIIKSLGSSLEDPEPDEARGDGGEDKEKHLGTFRFNGGTTNQLFNQKCVSQTLGSRLSSELLPQC